ncbi:MAG TPA: universal stress protein [Propionibacteriaceae bacterium]|nr:universal stress protein [Propionibacteriaceae bacterium]
MTTNEAGRREAGEDHSIETVAGAEQLAEAVDSTTIVVGHDGSGSADEALRVALRLGHELHSPVTVVRAWSIATAPRPANWKFGYVSTAEELEEAVRDDLVGGTRAMVEAFPTVTVNYRVYHSSPAKSLIQASEGARLLVVGSRGLGGFKEVVLGSVSEQCVRHASCPVLVTKRRTPASSDASVS